MTFADIYKIINPDELPSSWTPVIKRDVVSMVKMGCKVEKILFRLKLMPSDWTAKELGEMRQGFVRLMQGK